MSVRCSIEGVNEEGAFDDDEDQCTKVNEVTHDNVVPKWVNLFANSMARHCLPLRTSHRRLEMASLLSS